MKQRMCLVQDENCHWFCIPAIERDIFHQTMAAAYRDDDFSTFSANYDKYMINGPQTLTFVDPQDGN